MLQPMSLYSSIAKRVILNSDISESSHSFAGQDYWIFLTFQEANPVPSQLAHLFQTKYWVTDSTL